MTNPDQLFPENPDDLTPWHPLMGFGWDAVRLARAWNYCGIPEVRALNALRHDNPPARASQETEVAEELRPGENPMVNKVSGYRKLDDEELALINELKADGERIAERLKQVESLIAARTAKYATPDAQHYRALALGQTNIQQGYMWLIRAVAAPEGLV